MPVSDLLTRSSSDSNCETIAKAKSVAENINQGGGKAIAVPGDMTNDDYHSELVKQAAEFGNGKIHVSLSHISTI